MNTNGMSVRELASVAQCGAPSQVGGAFLRHVADLTTMFCVISPMEQAVHEIADRAVCDTGDDVWAVFTDLAAHTEDVSEFGPVSDMDTGARIALFMIARRLSTAIYLSITQTA